MYPLSQQRVHTDPQVAQRRPQPVGGQAIQPQPAQATPMTTPTHRPAAGTPQPQRLRQLSTLMAAAIAQQSVTFDEFEQIAIALRGCRDTLRSAGGTEEVRALVEQQLPEFLRLGAQCVGQFGLAGRSLDQLKQVFDGLGGLMTSGRKLVLAGHPSLEDCQQQLAVIMDALAGAVTPSKMEAASAKSVISAINRLGDCWAAGVPMTSSRHVRTLFAKLPELVTPEFLNKMTIRNKCKCFVPLKMAMVVGAVQPAALKKAFATLANSLSAMAFAQWTPADEIPVMLLNVGTAIEKAVARKRLPSGDPLIAQIHAVLDAALKPLATSSSADLQAATDCVARLRALAAPEARTAVVLEVSDDGPAPLTTTTTSAATSTLTTTTTRTTTTTSTTATTKTTTTTTARAQARSDARRKALEEWTASFLATVTPKNLREALAKNNYDGIANLFTAPEGGECALAQLLRLGKHKLLHAIAGDLVFLSYVSDRANAPNIEAALDAMRRVEDDADAAATLVSLKAQLAESLAALQASLPSQSLLYALAEDVRDALEFLQAPAEARSQRPAKRGPTPADLGEVEDSNSSRVVQRKKPAAPATVTPAERITKAKAWNLRDRPEFDACIELMREVGSASQTPLKDLLDDLVIPLKDEVDGLRFIAVGHLLQDMAAGKTNRESVQALWLKLLKHGGKQIHMRTFNLRDLEQLEAKLNEQEKATAPPQPSWISRKWAQLRAAVHGVSNQQVLQGIDSVRNGVVMGFLAEIILRIERRYTLSQPQVVQVSDLHIPQYAQTLRQSEGGVLSGPYAALVTDLLRVLEDARYHDPAMPVLVQEQDFRDIRHAHAEVRMQLAVSVLAAAILLWLGALVIQRFRRN